MRNRLKSSRAEERYKTVEYLKADLIKSVGELFKALIRANAGEIADAISNIVIISYILGRRNGVSFQATNQVLGDKITNTLQNVDSDLSWYQDLVDLQQYLEERKNQNR